MYTCTLSKTEKKIIREYEPFSQILKETQYTDNERTKPSLTDELKRRWGIIFGLQLLYFE